MPLCLYRWIIPLLLDHNDIASVLHNNSASRSHVCNSTSFLFTLLALLPCLCDFLFFPISILFLLFRYCFSNILIPAPCFLMPAWDFWQSPCNLCSIHHYIFHLLPVFIHIKVFPLCFCYLIFDHALVFFTSFPFWASIHALLIHTFKLLMPPICCIKRHVH